MVQGAWDWNLKRGVALVAAVLDGWGKKYLVGIEILIQASVLVSPRYKASDMPVPDRKRLNAPSILPHHTGQSRLKHELECSATRKSSAFKCNSKQPVACLGKLVGAQNVPCCIHRCSVVCNMEGGILLRVRDHFSKGEGQP